MGKSINVEVYTCNISLLTSALEKVEMVFQYFRDSGAVESNLRWCAPAIPAPKKNTTKQISLQLHTTYVHVYIYIRKQSSGTTIYTCHAVSKTQKVFTYAHKIPFYAALCSFHL